MTEGNDDERVLGLDPERIRSLRDPYADVDVSALPEWWQRAIEHFEARDIDPFRPPRFADGSLTHAVVAELESEFGVDIAFRCKNGTLGDDWTVTIDGDPIGSIGRHRSRKRYTVYEMSAAEFREWVSGAVADE